jgi:hypothetical protein
MTYPVMASTPSPPHPLPNVAQKGTGYASLWALVYVFSPMCYRAPHLCLRPAHL